MEENTIKNDTKSSEYLDPETKKFKEGNPGGGRPAGTLSMITLLKQELENIPEELKDKPLEEQKPWAKMVIRRWLENAGLKGDQKAIDSVVNRIDGQPTQEIKHTGEIEHIIELDDETKAKIKELVEFRKSKI